MLNTLAGIIASSGGAAAGGDYQSISTVSVGSGGSSSISFTSIPSTYQHLQVRYFSRNAAVTDTVLARFNSDSGSNYAWHSLRGNGASASAAASSSQSAMEMPFASYSGTTSNVFGGYVLDVLDYANTSKNKTLRILGGADLNGSGSIFFNSGLWMSTSAISTITIYPSTGNFDQYSSFALYGIKG